MLAFSATMALERVTAPPLLRQLQIRPMVSSGARKPLCSRGTGAEAPVRDWTWFFKRPGPGRAQRAEGINATKLSANAQDVFRELVELVTEQCKVHPRIAEEFIDHGEGSNEG